ncbi:MAG: hypothetical protein HW384_1419, partial [Dehalococcoidia bacterium]|nr:hypothetical protein [Dehalococcoidia bacterium]
MIRTALRVMLALMTGLMSTLLVAETAKAGTYSQPYGASK